MGRSPRSPHGPIWCGLLPCGLTVPMTPNPILGVFLHWLGGLASGSFYVPYRGVKRWAWETYWLVGGFFSWIIAPWTLATTMTNDVVAVISEAPGNSIF